LRFAARPFCIPYEFKRQGSKKFSALMHPLFFADIPTLSVADLQTCLE